jgi:uncharacterized protein
MFEQRLGWPRFFRDFYCLLPLVLIIRIIMNGDRPRFEWDDEKAEANYRKHGVDFAKARRVFDDLFAVERHDLFSATYGEDRFIITGMVGGALVTVVYTSRDADCIRLISARRASKREHDDYYRQNSQE